MLILSEWRQARSPAVGGSVAGLAQPWGREVVMMISWMRPMPSPRGRRPSQLSQYSIWDLLKYSFTEPILTLRVSVSCVRTAHWDSHVWCGICLLWLALSEFISSKSNWSWRGGRPRPDTPQVTEESRVVISMMTCGNYISREKQKVLIWPIFIRSVLMKNPF